VDIHQSCGGALAVLTKSAFDEADKGGECLYS
jgi:hypothetical protein